MNAAPFSAALICAARASRCAAQRASVAGRTRCTCCRPTPIPSGSPSSTRSACPCRTSRTARSAACTRPPAATNAPRCDRSDCGTADAVERLNEHATVALPVRPSGRAACRSSADVRRDPSTPAESTPFCCTPGPTNPSQVFAISAWMSPWFHANSGLMHVSHVLGREVGQEVVRVCEVRERRSREADRRPCTCAAPSLFPVGHRLHQRVRARSGVRIRGGEVGRRPLEARAPESLSGPDCPTGRTSVRRHRGREVEVGAPARVMR